MIQPKQKKWDVGVIVGRFQVPEIHESHRELIDYVFGQHPKVIILLGMTSIPDKENPLDFETRRQMLATDYPDANILMIDNFESDEHWSRNVDSVISKVVLPGQSAVLYGGRDSFISHYSGKYPTQELEADKVCSGTVIRKQTSVKAINHPAFRAGIIHAYYNQYPRVFTTVDVAIVKTSARELLLGKKPYQDLYRFIGGFAEPNSNNFEEDAMREVMEETGLSVHLPKYIASAKIDDWRLRKSRDKIKTIFYYCEYLSGGAKGADDIEKVKWFSVDDIKETDIVPEHRILFQHFKKYFGL